MLSVFWHLFNEFFQSNELTAREVVISFISLFVNTIIDSYESGSYDSFDDFRISACFC